MIKPKWKGGFIVKTRPTYLEVLQYDGTEQMRDDLEYHRPDLLYDGDDFLLLTDYGTGKVIEEGDYLVLCNPTTRVIKSYGELDSIYETDIYGDPAKD